MGGGQSGYGKAYYGIARIKSDIYLRQQWDGQTVIEQDGADGMGWGVCYKSNQTDG